MAYCGKRHATPHVQNLQHMPFHLSTAHRLNMAPLESCGSFKRGVAASRCSPVSAGKIGGSLMYGKSPSSTTHEDDTDLHLPLSPELWSQQTMRSGLAKSMPLRIAAAEVQ